MCGLKKEGWKAVHSANLIPGLYFGSTYSHPVNDGRKQFLKWDQIFRYNNLRIQWKPLGLV